MAKRKRFTKEQLIAYHEAGHAVAAHCLEWTFKHISTHPEKESDGRVEFAHREPAPSWTAEGAKQCDEEIMVLMAGIVAQSILRGRPNYDPTDVPTSHSDSVKVARIARQRCLIQLRLEVYGDKEMSAYLRWLRIRTFNLLKAKWGAVEALAGRLLERKRLTYDEAVEAMKQGPSYFMQHVDGDWQVVKEEAA